MEPVYANQARSDLLCTPICPPPPRDGLGSFPFDDKLEFLNDILDLNPVLFRTPG